MARLTKNERAQLLRTAAGTGFPAQPPAVSRPKDYIEFATAAARFARIKKPVRFTGEHWKL